MRSDTIGGSRFQVARHSLLLFLLLIVCCLPPSASAQSVPYREWITPDRQVIDSRGVDVLQGEVNVSTEPVMIGDLASAASWSGVTNFNKFRAYIAGGAPANADRYVFLHGKSFRFTVVSGTYVSASGDGSTLVKSTSGPEAYTYTSSDGKIYYFIRHYPPFQPDWSSIRAHLLTVTEPTGRKLTYYNKAVDGTSYCERQCWTEVDIRVQSIVSSDGFMLKANYAGSSYGANFKKLTSVQAINLSQEYCNPAADSCGSLTHPWPSQTFATTTSGSTSTQTITDSESTVTTVETVSGVVTEVTPPAESGGNLDATYSSGKVNQLTEDGATYNYTYSTSGSMQTTTITGPGSATETYIVDTTNMRPTSITTATGETTTFQYDASARMTRKTNPEGNYTQWTYDSRGNVTEIRHVAKPGSGLADIIETASFDATCTHVKKCNKPNYTIDARGKRTDYTYDTTHGGVTRVQLPAPGSGSPRPEINYSYTPLYAQVYNGSGVLVSVPDAEYKVTQLTTCATAATCAGSADETKVTIAYNLANLKPSSVTTAAGNGSVTSTVSYSYDVFGDIASIDGPLAGADDTTYYFYAPLSRRLRGIIGPDPDSAGPRQRAAIRHSMTGSKPITKTQTGTVTGTTLAALNAISAFQTVDYTYDVHRNKIKEVVSGTSGTTSVAQYSYDAKRRPECTALRMNPSTWSALPGSACTAATTGSHGPDRITRNSYDANNRITKVETALGTTAAADEVRTSYTANGQIAHVIDAESNRTTYIYDGHDRLSHTRYPVTTKGVNSSNAGDYEQLGYDAAGNVTSRRLRDGTTIAYSYDDLGRLVFKDLPSGEDDISYGYDLVGPMRWASQGGHTNGFWYDALGRLVGQTSPLGAIDIGYDAAGRRAWMVYVGSGLAINYDHDVAGNVLKIRENGATSGVGVLASYAYDDLGRRTSVTFGNGSVQSFAYDAASRLSTLTNNLGGSATTHDLTQTFGYNPAGQIANVTRSNDAYAWQAHYNVDRAYTTNGLNRIMNAGGAGFSYDARGNLTSDGTNSFTYTAENLLKSGPAGATLGYDPLGRLYQTVGGGVTTRFQYDGIDMIAEYDGSNTVQRRYVHGPGIDNPIVWYEGSDLTNPHWIHTDHQGSAIAASTPSGAAAINSYDEYGIPAPGNIGRFGYTGQTWLPELGMWYYKARIYSPTLGRFMQTDPIGYEDGMNWYNYVRGDPINLVDPLGLDVNCDDGGGCTDPGYGPIDIQAPTGGGSLGGLGRLALRLGKIVSGGGDGGSNHHPLPPQKSACAAALEQSGEIEYGGNTASGVILGGVQVSWGKWKNLTTGSHGSYKIYGVGLGAGIGVTRDYGKASSLADFVGYGESVSLEASVGPVGAGYSSSQNVYGKTVSQGGAIGYSPPTPGLGYRKLGVAATGTANDTSISDCYVNGK